MNHLKWFFYGFGISAILLLSTGCESTLSIPSYSQSVASTPDAIEDLEPSESAPPVELEELFRPQKVKKTLRLDSWRRAQNNRASFVSDMADGDIAATRFEYLKGPVTLQKIKVLFGGKDEQIARVQIRIWEDLGERRPGKLLHREKVLLTSKRKALTTIQLSESIHIPSGHFRIGIQALHDGLPTVGVDRDQKPRRKDFDSPQRFQKARDRFKQNRIHENSTFVRVRGMGWLYAVDAGLRGDWIIRAVIETTKVEK